MNTQAHTHTPSHPQHPFLSSGLGACRKVSSELSLKPRLGSSRLLVDCLSVGETPRFWGILREEGKVLSNSKLMARRHTLEEERPTLGLSIPSDIFHVAKLLVLCYHVWTTLDYPSRTCSSVTWPPFLASPPPNTHTFFGCKDLVAGEHLGVFFSQQQGGREAGADRGKGVRRAPSWTTPHITFGPILLWQRP